MRRISVLAVVAVVVAAAACADDGETAGSSTSGQTTSAPAPAPTTSPATTNPIPTTAAPTTVPATSEPVTTTPIEPATTTPAEPATTAPHGARWTETDVAGCVCSDGSPLHIYERVADPTKVALYFEGGGACFSAATCDPNLSPTYTVNRNGLTTDLLEQLGGYFDTDNPENPLASYSWVYVPYCTGDVHEGNATHDYGDGIVIEHRGHANAIKALDYLVANYPGAEHVLVTGESAGSVPTPVFGALAADALPDSDVVTFGDSSGAYPDVDAVNALIGNLWGFPAGVPDWPELDGLTVEEWSFPEQYIYAGQHAPRLRFGRFDHAFDQVQATFSAAAGIPADQLVTLIDANEAEIEAGGVEIAGFVAPGNRHTVSSTDEFYDIEVDGVRLVDWLRELIDDPQPPPDVHCVDCHASG